jgi:hypothetical protein
VTLVGPFGVAVAAASLFDAVMNTRLWPKAMAGTSCSARIKQSFRRFPAVGMRSLLTGNLPDAAGSVYMAASEACRRSKGPHITTIAAPSTSAAQENVRLCRTPV